MPVSGHVAEAGRPLHRANSSDLWSHCLQVAMDTAAELEGTTAAMGTGLHIMGCRAASVCLGAATPAACRELRCRRRCRRSQTW